MPISDTIYADWTPAGASNFAVCGDKLISWDIVSPFNRFVVWDLDDHTRNAYEITWDSGYAPPAPGRISNWSTAADATGVWIGTTGGNPGYVSFTKLKPDGSFEQRTTASQVKQIKGLCYDPVDNKLVTQVIIGGGSYSYWASFDLVTNSFSTGAGLVYDVMSGRPLIHADGYAYGAFYDRLHKVDLQAMTRTNLGNMYLLPGASVVQIGTKLYGKSGSSTVTEWDLSTNTGATKSSPVPMGQDITVLGPELISCPSATTISGLNPATMTGWVENKTNMTINGMFTYGGNAHGKT